MTTDSQIVVGRAAVGSKRKPKKTLLFPCLKETTDIVYRTGKAAREQVNLHDQNKQNKKASREQVNLPENRLPENMSTCTIKTNKTKKHPDSLRVNETEI